MQYRNHTLKPVYDGDSLIHYRDSRGVLHTRRPEFLHCEIRRDSDGVSLGYEFSVANAKLRVDNIKVQEI